MLYRALRNLSVGNAVIPFGSIFDRVYDPAVESLLIACGAIVEIQPPPLAVLPGWTVRTKRLAKIGIESVADLLACDVEAVALHMRCAPALVERWQQEVRLGLMGAQASG